MKKTLLLALTFFTITGLMAQKSALDQYKVLKKDLPTKKLVQKFVSGKEGDANAKMGENTLGSLKSAESAGVSSYDLQTNNSTCRRLAYDTDGNLHTGWTYSESFNLDAPDRGTGYNVYDGSAWGAAPTERAESDNIRTGWSNLFVLENGTVGLVAHTVADGLAISRKAPGDDAFTTAILSDPVDGTDDTWGKAVATGNNIHVITSRFTDGSLIGGVNRGITYYRSTDGGDSFDGPFELPGMGEIVGEIAPDGYSLDARGDKVVMTAGAYGRQTFVYTSEDNGDTWSSNVIGPTTDPLELDPASFDATFCGDQFTIGIDNSGKTHVAFTTLRNYYDPNGGAVVFTTTFTDIMYWNEDMAAPMHIGETFRMDADGDGNIALAAEVNFQLYGNQSISHPTIGFNENDDVFIAWDASVDGAVEDPTAAELKLFRDVFMVKSTDGGANWDGPLNVSNNQAEENVFPHLPRDIVGDMVPVLYQSDEFAGLAVYEDQVEYSENREEVEMVDPAAIVTPDYNAENNPPYMFVLWAGFGAAQGCDLTLDDLDIIALDYPDGDLTDQIVVTGNVDYSTPGVYEAYYSVMDSDGNSSGQDTIEITVIEDVTAPLIELVGQPEISVLVNTSYEDAGVNYADDSGCDISSLLMVDNPVDVTTEGTYTVTYNISDFAGNAAAELTRTVNVIGEDTEAPVITLADGDAIEVEGEFGVAFTPPAFTTIDNIDGDLTDETVVEGVEDVNLEMLGDYVISYTATDGTGNTITITQTVTVVDNTAPEINLDGGATIFHICDTEFEEPGYTATDAFDGDLTANVVVSGEVCVTDPATYSLTYTVSDNSGNPGSSQRTVVVSQSPEAGAPECSNNGSCVPGGVGLRDFLLNNNIQLTPNPSQGLVNLNMTDVETSTMTVEVYNIVGDLIDTIVKGNLVNAANFNIDLTNASAGTYFVKVITESGDVTKKINIID